MMNPSAGIPSRMLLKINLFISTAFYSMDSLLPFILAPFTYREFSKSSSQDLVDSFVSDDARLAWHMLLHSAMPKRSVSHSQSFH